MIGAKMFFPVFIIQTILNVMELVQENLNGLQIILSKPCNQPDLLLNSKAKVEAMKSALF